MSLSLNRAYANIPRPPHPPNCLHGQAVDGISGEKPGGSHPSLSKKRDILQRSKEQHRMREDLVLSWEARRGSSTALIGLGRGREALAEAEDAMELADQVCVCMPDKSTSFMRALC